MILDQNAILNKNFQKSTLIGKSTFFQICLGFADFCHYCPISFIIYYFTLYFFLSLFNFGRAKTMIVKVLSVQEQNILLGNKNWAYAISLINLSLYLSNLLKLWGLK